MKKTAVGFSIFMLMTCVSWIHADVDESELFGSEESVVDVETVRSDSVISNLDSEKVSFSGVLYDRTTYSMRRDWLTGKTNWNQNSLFTYLEGNVSLDIRLRKDVKAYINLDAYYTPQGQFVVKEYKKMTSDSLSYSNVTVMEKLDTIVDFKEIFLSANLDRKVYFVLGKQVLQWGRTYFWQPTDLINIDRKDFFNMDNQIREGNFGLKLHVPFGTRANIYGFVDANGADNFDDLATAGKAEWLLGRTEFAFSAWQKKSFFPVYGVDFSTRLLDFSISGEAAVSTGDNMMKLKKTNIMIPYPPFIMHYAPYREREKLVYRACISISRSFTWELQDRIMVIGEFLYNSEGYDDNMFNVDSDSRDMFMSGFYRSGYYGKYYGAIFSSINHFFHQDVTFRFNAMANLQDLSYVASTGITWMPTFNFSVGLGVNGFFGPPNTEYVYPGLGMTSDLTLSIKF